MNDIAFLRMEIEGLIPKIHTMVLDRAETINQEITRQFEALTANNCEAMMKIIAEQTEKELRNHVSRIVYDKFDQILGQYDEHDADKIINKAMVELIQKNGEVK